MAPPSRPLQGKLLNQTGGGAPDVPGFPYTFVGSFARTAGPAHPEGTGFFEFAAPVPGGWTSVQWHLPGGAKVFSEELDLGRIPAGTPISFRVAGDGASVAVDPTTGDASPGGDRPLRGRLVDARGAGIGGVAGFPYTFTGQQIRTGTGGQAGEFAVAGGVPGTWTTVQWHTPGQGKIFAAELDLGTMPSGADVTFLLGWNGVVTTSVPGDSPPMGLSRAGSRLRGPGLLDGMLIGTEYLAALSEVQSDPVRTIQSVRAFGFDVIRVMTTMSRSAWGDRPARRRPPPPGWFVPAWNDDGSVNPAWTDGRDALLETARALGVYVVYCLFDEPARTDRAPYLPDGSPTGPGQSFPARHNTWNGRSPGRAVASDLLWGTYLAGLDPVAHPELILLDANEPPPNPGPGSWWTPADHAWMRRELADHGWGGHLLQIDVREDSLSDDAPDVKAEHFYPQNAENPNFPLLAQVQQGTGGGGPRVALSSSDGQFLWDIDKPNANAVKLADRGVCSTWMAVNPLHDLAPSELRVLRGIARALDL